MHKLNYLVNSLEAQAYKALEGLFLLVISIVDPPSGGLKILKILRAKLLMSPWKQTAYIN